MEIEKQKSQEELLFSWLPSQRDSMLALCEQLANMSSSSGDMIGLRSIQKMLFNYCRRLNGTARSIELPASLAFDGSCRLVERLHPEAIAIEKRQKAPFRLLLGGHFDTALPLTKQCRLEGNRLFGSGVCDMKGGIVVLLTALQAFEKSSLAPCLGWDLLLTGDEELGSPSSHSLWRQYAWRNRLCLLFEPSLKPGVIAAERMASLNLLVSCKGRQAHAGRRPQDGASAIDALLDLLQCIKEKLGAIDKKLLFNVGRIAGGQAANIIAEEACALINIRANDDEAIRLSEEAIASCCLRVREKDLRLEAVQKKLTLRPHKPWRQIDQHFFNLLQGCAERLSMQVDCQPSAGVCDGNIAAAEGIPVLDTLGVDGGAIHTAEEWLDVDSLLPKAQLATAFLFALANAADRS